MKLIYRVADGLIVGTVQPPQPEAVELENILRSELGGVAADYAFTADVPPKGPGEMYRVNPAGIVLVVPDPVVAKRNADRASARAKLVALGGLTPDELDAL